MTAFQRVSSAACVLLLGLLGCSSASIDDGDTPPDMMMGPDYGLGDGTLNTVELQRAYIPPGTGLSATDLAWNAAVPGELWVTLRKFPSGMPCTEQDSSGCDALPGVVAIVNVDTGEKATIKADGNAWHFMRRPTSLAWGDGELFASCGESLTDNYEDVPVPYAGPTLWSSNPAIFGVKPSAGQNGTHLDMLHETPYCMGIAHEQANAFWVFNGDAGSLDRYDFHVPHQIGGEDHADGEVYRYVTGELLRVPEIPSHLVYDAARNLVYVADTGHGRVLSVDPTTATLEGDIETYETLAGSGEMVGATVEELIPPGTLQAPSGIALVGDLLYVTDHATSVIHVFDTGGKPLASLDTKLPAGSLSGIAIGPDQRLYFTDMLTGEVRRIYVWPE